MSRKARSGRWPFTPLSRCRVADQLSPIALKEPVTGLKAERFIPGRTNFGRSSAVRPERFISPASQKPQTLAEQVNEPIDDGNADTWHRVIESNCSNFEPKGHLYDSPTPRTPNSCRAPRSWRPPSVPTRSPFTIENARAAGSSFFDHLG
jgi:hypothetical protein